MVYLDFTRKIDEHLLFTICNRKLVNSSFNRTFFRTCIVYMDKSYKLCIIEYHDRIWVLLKCRCNSYKVSQMLWHIYKLDTYSNLPFIYVSEILPLIYQNMY